MGAVFDANVVGEGVAPGFADFESALEGGGHETEFDPFAALFVGFEDAFVWVHVVSSGLNGAGAKALSFFVLCATLKRRSSTSVPAAS